MASTQRSFRESVWLTIASIPSGRVACYGDIARMAGMPGAARQVGSILRKLPAGSQLPWFRVINAKGRISLSGADLTRQIKKLQAEGIEVSADGQISLKEYRWEG